MAVVQWFSHAISFQSGAAMDRRRPRKPPARPLVLIADGHDDTLELYAIALSAFGFDVITVGIGAQVFERAWETHPDVIVTEVSLPGQDGWSLVDRLRLDARTR